MRAPFTGPGCPEPTGHPLLQRNSNDATLAAPQAHGAFMSQHHRHGAMQRCSPGGSDVISTCCCITGCAASQYGNATADRTKASERHKCCHGRLLQLLHRPGRQSDSSGTRLQTGPNAKIGQPQLSRGSVRRCRYSRPGTLLQTGTLAKTGMQCLIGCCCATVRVPSCMVRERGCRQGKASEKVSSGCCCATVNRCHWTPPIVRHIPVQEPHRRQGQGPCSRHHRVLLRQRETPPIVGYIPVQERRFRQGQPARLGREQSSSGAAAPERDAAVGRLHGLKAQAARRPLLRQPRPLQRRPRAPSRL